MWRRKKPACERILLRFISSRFRRHIWNLIQFYSRALFKQINLHFSQSHSQTTNRYLENIENYLEFFVPSKHGVPLTITINFAHEPCSIVGNKSAMPQSKMKAKNHHRKPTNLMNKLVAWANLICVLHVYQISNRQ